MAVRRAERVLLVVVMLSCCATLLLGYANKARCTGPSFDGDGRSTAFLERQDAQVCYSDVQGLWLGRDVSTHVFPYVHGSLTVNGTLVGGSLEYPVLTGVLIWAAALGAHSDAGFLLATALLLAPFGLLTAWLLARMTRWRALVFTATPPLVLYAVQNWELPVVGATVLAVWLVSRWRVPLRRRAVVASVVLGIGFCLKLYPGAFVAPLALLVLTGGVGGRELPEHLRGAGRRLDVGGALAVLGAAAATVVAVNLPFALAGPTGWWASFQFQGMRTADLSSDSIWYWGLRPIMDRTGNSSGSDAYEHLVTLASPTLVLVSFVVALSVGWRRYRRGGTYPWLAVSAAMLCGFLLLHKVHSPQYTLWLLPFLALLRVRWPLVVAYLVCDLAMEVGIFRYFELGVHGDVRPGATALEPGSTAGTLDQLTPAAVLLGVWGRAALLVVLFVVFLRSTPVGPTVPDQPAQVGRERPPRDSGVRYTSDR